MYSVCHLASVYKVLSSNSFLSELLILFPIFCNLYKPCNNTIMQSINSFVAELYQECEASVLLIKYVLNNFFYLDCKFRSWNVSDYLNYYELARYWLKHTCTCG